MDNESLQRVRPQEGDKDYDQIDKRYDKEVFVAVVAYPAHHESTEPSTECHCYNDHDKIQYCGQQQIGVSMERHFAVHNVRSDIADQRSDEKLVHISLVLYPQKGQKGVVCDRNIIQRTENDVIEQLVYRVIQQSCAQAGKRELDEFPDFLMLFDECVLVRQMIHSF